MAFDHRPLVLPIRIAQTVLAIIILGLLAYSANVWWWNSPSQVNFNIFASVFTLLAVAYLIITPLHAPKFAHKYGILSVEFVTMIFWFAGFIALAVLLTDVGCTGRQGGACGASIAADVFGAFEWLLFSATTAMAAHYAYNNRHTHNNAHDPAMEVQTSAKPFEGV